MAARPSPAIQRAVDVALAADMAGKPWTASQLREQLGLSGVQMTMVRAALERRGIRLKAMRDGSVIAERREEVLRLHAEGLSQLSIAERVKMSRSYVREIVSGLPRNTGMTPEAKVDRAIEAEQRKARLAAGQGDFADAPPPWKRIVPPARMVESLANQHGGDRVKAYEAAQWHVYRSRHGVSITS